MILGVEHIALSCTTIEEVTQVLAQRGFACSFTEREMRNPPEKKSLLRRWSATHDIASFRSSRGGIAVEAISNGAPPGAARSGYDISGWSLGDQGISCVRVDVPDLGAALRFWRAAGFRPGSDASPSRLVMRAPVAAWELELELRSCSTVAPSWLDDEGFPCLALISNRLEADLDRIRGAGAWDATVPFEACVAGRVLRIALCRAPGGQFVELIELAKVERSR